MSFPYIINTGATRPPISLDTVKAWAEVTDNCDDALLWDALEAATNLAECDTKRTFITTEFKTFRNCFGYWNYNKYCDFIELRKSALISITSFTYVNNQDQVITLVDGDDYYIEFSNDFSRLHPVNGWPTDVKDRLQSIEIIFQAGYGSNLKDIPPKLRQALKMHVLTMYTNRGDCACEAETTLPALARSAYKSARILDI